MRNLVFLFLALAGLYSCTKPQGIQPTYISAGFKSYFDYKPGSYWVFYDSLNNIFDSVAVTSYTDNQVTTTKTSTEEVSIAMQAVYEDSTGGTWQWDMFLGGNTCSIQPIQPGYYSYYQDYGDELAVGMPFQIGTNTFSNSQGEQVVLTTTLLPLYSIGPVTYSNVYQVINSFDGYYNADTFYINQDQGLLAILLNSQHHQRLFLARGNIVH